jgi:hypothetical protein
MGKFAMSRKYYYICLLFCNYYVTDDCVTM